MPAGDKGAQRYERCRLQTGNDYEFYLHLIRQDAFDVNAHRISLRKPLIRFGKPGQIRFKAVDIYPVK